MADEVVVMRIEWFVLGFTQGRITSWCTKRFTSTNIKTI